MARRRQMGRPTDLTADLQSRICEYISNGLPSADAAVRAGIGRSTFYQWTARGRDGEQPYADFAEAVERARAEFKATLIDTVMMHATADTPQSGKLALDAYKEFEGSSRGAEREKAREEVTREILDGLRSRLDTATFAEVVDALSGLDSEDVPAGSTRRVH